MKFIIWLKRVFYWLYDTKGFWIPIISIPIIYIITDYLTMTLAAQARLAGLILQLIGLLIVARGIIRLRKIFNLPTYRHIFSESIKNFPRFKKSQVLHVGSGALSVSGASANLTVRTKPPKNATLEQSVNFLLTEHGKSQERFDRLEKGVNEVSKEHRSNINNLKSEHDSKIENIEKFIKSITTDDIHTETVGIICLIVGTVLSTLSGELS